MRLRPECPKKELSLSKLYRFQDSERKPDGRLKSLPDLYGGLAQLGERLPCKQEVSGSNPLISIPGSLAQSVRALA